MQQYIEIMKETFFLGNSLYSYFLALAVFVGLLLALKIFQTIILSKLRKLAKKTKTEMDDIAIEIFKNIKPPFYLFVALYFGLIMLNLSNTTYGILKVAVIIIIIYEVIRALERIIDFVADKYLEKSSKEDRSTSQSMVNALRFIIRIVLWTVGLLLVLSNIGINVNSLIASVGVGGIAIALAVQNILGDIFSSFSIYIDKPFRVGDYIKVGENSGTVKKIGLKTTRMKTLRGEELIVSNKELTSAKIQNFKELKKRREVFMIGIEYGIPASKLEAIPKIIKELAEGIKKVEFERCYFKEYGDFSLNFETSYYVDSAKFDDAAKIRQKLNILIYKRFEKEGIPFAFPTQTIHMINK